MDLKELKIGFIGAGNMGSALIAGLIESGAIPAAQVQVKNRRPERSKALADTFGLKVAPDNAHCARGQDIVVLAVKPQIFPRVLQEIKDDVGSALIISVAAGVSTERIEQELGQSNRIIRAMPNTPATVKAGATAIAPGAHATAEDIELGRQIFEQIGEVVVVEEPLINAVTGLSGSGPAYVFLIVEAFADAGVKVGLSREVAMKLAVQTLLGSAQLLKETGEHPMRLKDQVTSPGGTAIAGLHTLEQGGLRTTIINAVEAATKRAQELGKA